MADIFDLTPEELALDIADFIGQEISSSVYSLKDYSVDQGDGQLTINLSLDTSAFTPEELALPKSMEVDREIPPFDMRFESEYIPSLERVVGNLLGGPKTRISKQGNRYNIIPLPNGDFRTVSDGAGLDKWQFKGQFYTVYQQSAIDFASSALDLYLSSRGGRI